MSDQNNRIYSTMETDGQVVDGCVPVEELKELVAEWHKRADANDDVGYEYDGAAYRSTATELQELVEQYE